MRGADDRRDSWKRKVVGPYKGRKRDPFADRKSPFEHFTLKNLFLQSVHAVAFTAVPILAAATPQEEPEDEDELQLLDWDILEREMRGFKTKCFKMFLRVVGCTSLKRSLEGLAVRWCSVKTASRFVKDPVKSAMRKYARHGRLRAACFMIRTSAYANFLAYFSNLLIEQSSLLYQYHRARRDSTSPKTRRQLLVEFSGKSARVCLGHGAAFLFSSLGIAVGTLLKPGWGTVVGGAFGDMGGLLLIT